MKLKDRARAGGGQRVRLVAAGAAAGTGLALMIGPSALATPPTSVGCSAASLAAAVSGAQSGTVLSLAPRCNYVLSSGLEATVSLAIRGNGDTITAGTSGLTLMLVDAGTTVSLSDLTLSNGAPAIQNNGTLTVSDSTFTGNAGAIVNGNTATVDNSTFTGNTGAISNLGYTVGLTATLTVTNSSFTGNTVSGAIYSDGNERAEGGPYEANIIVTGSSFRNNSSSDVGGAIYSGNSEGTLKDDWFTGNTATLGGGGVANGCRSQGGLICATLAIDNSTFSGNTAGQGGAISNNATLTLTDSSLSRNAATDPTGGYGGGLDGTGTITNTQITDNTASVDGGGIYGGDATLSDTQVRNNTPDNCAPAGTIAGCTN